jgi:superoxide dismutase, Fe-Mn family
MSNRRTFLASTLATGIAVAAGTHLNAIGSAPVGAGGKHELPNLPYDYAALEPFIDAQTMKLHHDKHHLAYVNGLNKAEEMLALARSSSDYALIQHWSKQAAFHGGGHWLHSMFWKTMAPQADGGGGEPTGRVKDMIRESFGTFQAFRKQFTAAAGAVEGSGWGLLFYHMEDERLLIGQAENQHKLTMWGAMPILGVDVWEHAYYLKYQNNRPDYIEAWWNLVNWKQVEMNLMYLQ